MNITLRPLTVAVLAALMFNPRLSAQDVTVGDPGWFQSEGVPEAPPQARRNLRADYPEELRQRETNETGYVIVTRYLDAKGQSLVLETRSAYPWFKRSVGEPPGDHGTK